jgi:hypothetical protein
MAARWLSQALVACAASLSASTPVRAADGCLVLLCFAAPSWSAIQQCVAPIRSVLRDLARGRPFPSCGMSNSANNASHRGAVAPGYCPEQYVRVFQNEGGSLTYTCAYDGAVSVVINGALWARTWWSMSGDSVTEFTPTAKATLVTYDTRFDDDYAAWLAPSPPLPAPDLGY